MKNKNKLLFMILISFSLMILAYYITHSYKTRPTLFENSMFIMIAGEGAKHVCTPDIMVSFDDKGITNINFKSEKKEEIVWMDIYDEYPFDWEIKGNIQKMDYYGRSILGKYGFNENFLRLRISITSKEAIILKTSHPIDETLFYISIHSPLICAQTFDRNSMINKINNLSDYIQKNEEVNSTETDYKDIITNLFSLENVGDYVLFPALAKISVTYDNNISFNPSYRLKARPQGYQRSIADVSWNGFQQIFPRIEYEKERAIFLSKKIVEILYLLSSFMITTAVIDGIFLLKKRIKK